MKLVSSDQHVSLPTTIDDNNNRQQLIPPSGVRQVGQWGNGPLEFWCPSGLAITRNNDHLIVVDSWNHRLQVFNDQKKWIYSCFVFHRC